MSHVRELITKRFFEHYGAPKDHPNLDAYVAEYERALAGTDSILLRDAASLAIDQHTYPSWPTVGQVKQAVEIVATRRGLAHQQRQWGKNDEPPRQEPSEASRARVDALMKATVAKLKTMGPKTPKADPIDWARASKPAWEKRIATDPTARRLARYTPEDRGQS